LLPVRQRVSGPNDPATLTAQASLARWTGEAGDPERALALYTKLLPLSEQILGTEHADTMATRDGIAKWTGECGDPAKARDLYSELLPARERLLGHDHPVTSATRRNLSILDGASRAFRTSAILEPAANGPASAGPVHPLPGR
jgi:hypothetical protein